MPAWRGLFDLKNGSAGGGTRTHMSFHSAVFKTVKTSLEATSVGLFEFDWRPQGSARVHFSPPKIWTKNWTAVVGCRRCPRSKVSAMPDLTPAI